MTREIFAGVSMLHSTLQNLDRGLFAVHSLIKGLGGLCHCQCTYNATQLVTVHNFNQFRKILSCKIYFFKNLEIGMLGMCFLLIEFRAYNYNFDEKLYNL